MALVDWHHNQSSFLFGLMQPPEVEHQCAKLWLKHPKFWQIGAI
jgi:hypothetical protein